MIYAENAYIDDICSGDAACCSYKSEPQRKILIPPKERSFCFAKQIISICLYSFFEKVSGPNIYRPS